MSRFALFALVIGIGFSLTAGCGKKPDPAPANGETPGGEAPQDPALTARNAHFAKLKTNNQEAKRAAVEDLSWLAEDDPEVLPALVELLKDKGTAGAGRTLTNQINSTREAAALTLLQCGKKGEALLKEKGVPILRAELADKSPVIREHTIYTIGQLGTVGVSLAPDVQKLCTDTDANVRGAAFDALRVLGVPDPTALAKLLTHDDAEIARLAAELIGTVAEIPKSAVDPLRAALTSANTNIRREAANALGRAGPNAASAVPDLITAITTLYPAEASVETNSENLDLKFAYWQALGRIGEPAVAPTTKLLDHTNPLVQFYAMRTLGNIGPPAKPAADALKKRLADRDPQLALESACALIRIGEAKDEALALVQRALDSPVGLVAGEAINVILRIGEAGKPLIPAALKHLASTSALARYKALELVSTLPPAEAAKVVPEMSNLVTDEDRYIREAVGQLLQQLGPAAAPAAEALGKALPDEKEPDIRNQFVEALLAMGPDAKPALPGLLPLVSEKGLPYHLRAKAALAVAVIDPTSPDVSSALIKATADSDNTVSSAAILALGKLNPLSPEALAALVKLANPRVKYPSRLAALKALTAAGPRAKSAKAELEAMTNDPLKGLALWATVAVAAIDGDVKKSAVAVRAGLNDRNALVRSSAAEALLLIGPTTDDLPALLKLLRDVSETTKSAAATATGQLGASAKDAVPLLIRLLDDRDPEVRVATTEALGHMGDAAFPAIPKLKELAGNYSDNSGTRPAAKKALEKLGVR
ncbi:MAG: HEAT repeat domain-containing protein [Planctomycetia bacterium]|nr:HEAT repeat domain-containing protein [Planctomycetia bacterium]